MPAVPSRSPRKSGSPAKQRTRWSRIVSVTPLQGTRSKRTSLRAANAEDALARERDHLIDLRLEKIGLPTEGEIPASLGALLKQRGSPPGYNFNVGFGDDDFGGFDGHTTMDMDNSNDEEWCSEEELEDDIEDEVQSTGKPSDHKIRSEAEVNNWTKFIDIVTGDTVMQGCSPFCTCTKSTRSIPTVSLSAGYVDMKFQICEKACPLRKGMLDFFSKGYYPSSPVKPRFAFHMDVLFFFHEMYMRGQSSKQVFAYAVRSLVQSKSMTPVPPIYKRFLSVYSVWADVEAIMDAKVDHFLRSVSLDDVMEDIEESTPITPPNTAEMQQSSPDNTTPLNTVEKQQSSADESSYKVLKPLPLSTLCPQCFGDNPRAEIGFISLDANFQHKRFPTKKDDDNKYLELRDKRLFIDDGTIPDVKSEPKDQAVTTCTRNFTAAAERNTAKLQAIVDSGIMAAVCRCGVPLRLHNIRGTGERSIYAVRLLKSIMEDPSCPRHLMLSYDIACIFSKYIQPHLTSEEAGRLTFSIGIFHCFAHDYQCQIEFSPRMIPGMGWADGEGTERAWSDSRHVIAANRSTKASTRRQTVTNVFVSIGQNRVINFPMAVRKKILTMLKTGQEAEKELNSYCDSNDITIDTLQQEAAAMRAFLLRSDDSTIHIEDDICEHLQAIDDFCTFELVHAQAVDTAGHDWIQCRLNIALKTEGRISQDLGITTEVLEARVLGLLKKAGQTMEDWIQGGVKTDLYLDRLKEIKLTNMRRRKVEIFRLVVLRKQEWNGLIGSSLHGTHDAGKIKKTIITRTKKVVSLIKEYNQRLEQLPDYNLRPISTDKDLDELLLNDSALWDLDRYSCTDRWARDRLMQHAFKHLYDVTRAKEEVIILLAQGQRHVNWYIADIRKVTMALGELRTKDCELRRRLLKRAQVATVTLRSWDKFQDVIKIIRTHDICDEVLLVSVEGTIANGFLSADGWDHLLSGLDGLKPPAVLGCEDIGLDSRVSEIRSEIAAEIATELAEEDLES